MKIVSLKLSDALNAQLSAQAKQRRTSKSALVREALEVFFASEKQPRAGSFLDLAGDLIGSLEGPGDLSYNKEHLRDYGR